MERGEEVGRRKDAQQEGIIEQLARQKGLLCVLRFITIFGDVTKWLQRMVNKLDMYCTSDAQLFSI